MTTSELIEKLQQYPPDTPVVVNSTNYYTDNSRDYVTSCDVDQVVSYGSSLSDGNSCFALDEDIPSTRLYKDRAKTAVFIH